MVESPAATVEAGATEIVKSDAFAPVTVADVTDNVFPPVLAT
jgi:hypothetical protein